jgi:N-acetylglucosaminyldiphosphoundecaprenol N-acetyl-beta-D-mannosaminyltransferase
MNGKEFLKPLPGSMDLMGIPIHPGGIGTVEAQIEEAITRKAKAVVVNTNVHGIYLAKKNPWLLDFLKNARMVFCDGNGPRWGLIMLGYAPPPKIATTRWIWQLAAFCARKKYRLFLLGGWPGVAAEAAERLTEAWPDLGGIGFHHGFFGKQGPENEKVIEAINVFKPDILLVCFGMPIQEKWIYDNASRVNAHVFLKGGAVLDYVTGRLGKVPDWMIEWHLEWLFRVYEEPRRLFIRYVVEIPWFLTSVALERVGRIIWRRSRTEPQGPSSEIS